MSNHQYQKEPKSLTEYEAASWFTEGLLWVDKEGNIIQVDQEISALCGYNKEELLSMKIFFLFPAIKKIDLMRYWRDMRQEKFKKWKTDLLTQDEQYIPKEILGKLVEVEGEEYSCWGIQETTSLKQEVFANDRGNTRWAEWEWSISQQQFLVEPAFYDILEIPPQGEMLSINDLMHILDDRLSSALKLKLANSISDMPHAVRHIERIYEIDVQGKSKQIFVSFQPERKDDEMIGFRGIVQELPSPQDDTDADFNRLSKLALDKSPAIIIWVNPNCSLNYVNEAACAHLGYSKQQLLDTLLITKIDAENEERQWEIFWQLLKQKDHLQVETFFLRSNGTVFPTEMYLNYLHIGEQSLICINARDITKRRKEEARLRNTLMENQSLSIQLEAENLYLKEELSTENNFENIVSQSKAYRSVLRKVEQVAPTDSTVLILGETGTGKELLARAIHTLSKRKRRPLIKVNCAVLPKELIESELFGHEKGAFTGAYSQKIGRFELANNGTLFLDEIGEMPLDLQVKLLRVLQEGEFERLGGTKTLQVDVRIIAATNRNLDKMLEEGSFRMDLFYRLNVFPIENLPLRDRRDDIPLLVKHFVGKFSDKVGKKIDKIRPDDLKKLKRYDFPGNIRELENIIERAVILCRSNTLRIPDAQISKSNAPREEQEIKKFDDMQRDYIIQVLETTRWKVSGPNGAAELLGLKDQTLYSKMRKLGIKRT